jgi:hypothetical protein
VASFMPISLDLGMTHRWRGRACGGQMITRNTPTTNIRFRFESHSANIDRIRFDP